MHTGTGGVWDSSRVSLVSIICRNLLNTVAFFLLSNKDMEQAHARALLMTSHALGALARILRAQKAHAGSIPASGTKNKGLVLMRAVLVFGPPLHD